MLLSQLFDLLLRFFSVDSLDVLETLLHLFLEPYQTNAFASLFLLLLLPQLLIRLVLIMFAILLLPLLLWLRCLKELSGDLLVLFGHKRVHIGEKAESILL
jgi:hypothetical protein